MGCNMDMTELLDLSFDSSFDILREKGLTWRPWVGVNYEKSKFKILIAAESHYSNNEDAHQCQIDLKQICSDADYTRAVIWESAISQDYPNKMCSNLHRTLLQTDQIDDKSLLWKNISFYNFIQRPMNYGKQNPERPKGADFASGWRTFIGVVKTLQPKVCVFVGVASSNYFDDAMATLGIEHEGVKRIDFINSAHFREASICVNGVTTKMFFIKHTSVYFSWSTWHEALKNKIPNELEFLKKCVVNESSTLPIDIEGSPESIPTRHYTEKIPTHLAHKPIIACAYSELFNADYEDTQYISIGRAQYNNNAVSVKMLRYSGKRWSRQSEEIPIHRMAYMMQMFLTGIVHTQLKEGRTFQSSAHEEVVTPEDMDFLKTELNANRKEIIEGLQAVKDLLNQISLEKI